MCLGAVLFLNGAFYYLWDMVPAWLAEQLNERSDNYIRIAECLAVIIALETWKGLLKNQCVTVYTDNDGVLAAVVKGATTSPEVNLLVAKLWLLVAEFGIGFEAFRVESRANISDGPSRKCFIEVTQLCAMEVIAIWSAWMLDLWRVSISTFWVTDSSPLPGPLVLADCEMV